MSFEYQKAWYLFNGTDIKAISQDRYVLNYFPVVYIIISEDDKLAYVGETTNAVARMSAHLSHQKKSQLEKVLIISSEYLNKSAALDIESNLIQHMPSLGFELLNANGGIANHNYYQKNLYYHLFEQIWAELDFSKTKMKSLLEIQNSDIFKYSPYKALTQDQYNSIVEILTALANNNACSIFVDGAAGTGKTILAIYLVKLLSGFHRYNKDELDFNDQDILFALDKLRDLYPRGLNIAFVVPMSSLRKTLKKVFSKVYGLSGSMVIGPNDIVKKHYDFIVVDEAHRLARRKGIMGYGAYDQVNKKFRFEKEATQLDWVMKGSKAQVLFYDEEQSIKPADVRKEDFEAYKSNSHKVHLTSQLRSRGGKDYLDFVDRLLNSKPLPDSHFSSSEYELYLFEDMKAMVDQLQKKEHELGLSRLMSGFSWDWVSKKDNVPDVVIDGVALTWNRDTSDWINSTTSVTEMGCIHTVQGYDLNFAAIIFGNEISYDTATREIKISKDNYKDKKGKVSLLNEEELFEYIIKIYKTMMYRGIHGTYIYVCDDSLRDYFSHYIQKFNTVN